MIGGNVLARLLDWLRGRSGKPQGEAGWGRSGRIEKIDPGQIDFLPDDLEHLPAILDRLESLRAGPLNLLLGDMCDPGDFMAAVKLAAERGYIITVRGRATELAKPGFRNDLESARIEGIECLFLSAIDEVHDALAGFGDCRLAKSLLEHAMPNLPCTALVPLAPATVDVLDRTIEYLIEHSVPRASFFAIASADDEPSSWALSVDALNSVAIRLTENKRTEISFDWYPPLRFDPTQTLAQQIRRGPRCKAMAIRVTCDGSVYQPVGPWRPSGNLLESTAFVPKVHRAAGEHKCAACRCPEYCVAGCLRDVSTWA